MVAEPVLPNFTSQSASAYKSNIDAGFSVLQRLAWAFAPHDFPGNMRIRIVAGAIFDGATLTEVAAQSTLAGEMDAPTTNPRIDRVVIDRATGAYSIITGTEDASPVPPAITGDVVPVAQVALVVSQSTIVNDDITDERDLRLLGLAALALLGIGNGVESVSGNLRVKLDQFSIKRSAAGITVDVNHQRSTSANVAIALSDRGRLIEADRATAITFDLLAAVTATEGWFFYAHNSGAGDLIIDPDGSELIDDATTIVLKQGEGVLISCDGAAFWTVGRAAAGATKEFFVPLFRRSTGFPYSNTIGDFPATAGEGSPGSTRCVFHVPNDFSALTDAIILIIPDTTETVQWDCDTDWGADDELHTANSDSIVDATESVTVNRLEELDISGAFTGIAAGDYVGVNFISNTNDLFMLGFRFRYT